MTEQRFSKSELKFKEFASALDIPVMMLDKQDMIIFLNQKFSDDYGYDLTTISSWNTWSEKAFPDPNDQNALEQMLKSEGKEKPEYRQKFFELTCGDRTKKSVSMKLIPFSDGMKGVILSPLERTDSRNCA